MPTERELRPLRELVDLVRDKVTMSKDRAARYVGLEHLASGSPDLVDTASAASSVSTNGVFQADDVLFGKLRPNLRKCVLAPFAGYCSTDILVLRPRSGTCPSFAAKALQSEAVVREAVATAIGTKMPRTSWDALEHVRVFCPDEGEQRRIAEVIDTLDEAIRRTEQLIEKLEQVKQGLLHDLLTRGIGDNGELRDPEQHPAEFKDTPIGRLPRSWEVRAVDELLADVDPAMRSGPFGSALLKSELADHGVPLLGIDNVHVEKFVPCYTRFVTPQKALELARFRVRPGDLMITIMGTVGRCCVVPADVEEALSSKHVWTLTLDQSKYSSALACLQFNYAPWVRTHLRRDEQGGIMSAIRSDTLRTTILPVPPRSERSEIEHVLCQASTRLRAERQAVATQRLLRLGLMADLVGGHVRVRIAAGVPA